jgi:hypothetical protein
VHLIFALGDEFFGTDHMKIVAPTHHKHEEWCSFAQLNELTARPANYFEVKSHGRT